MSPGTAPLVAFLAVRLAMGAAPIPAPRAIAPPASPSRLQRAAALQQLSGELGRLTQAPPAFVSRAQKMNDTLTQALRQGNSSRATLVFATDAILMPSSGDIAMGRAEIQKYWKDLLGSGAVELRLTMVSSSTQGRLGHQAGNYEMVVRAPGGASVDRGEFMSVMRRGSDGRWLTIYAVFNSLR